eukprot:TRINITY_DN47553_c0_g1_i1.p2 TRINITY_DN47553_c0_g1~~TRINITY_DN47553_c0_g1_i1.p2  ORF type:complete len:160 (+),score=56.25 TRINITY_DN47553_c0_g1_i1:59-481(+)
MGVQASMEKAMKSNTQNMIEAQQKVAMRQREMMMAMQIAQARDFFKYYMAFTGSMALLGTIAVAKGRSRAAFAPLFPLGFGAVYQYDFAYGNKLQRVRAEAGVILDENWRLGDENPFLLPENNLLMDRATYDKYTAREKL